VSKKLGGIKHSAVFTKKEENGVIEPFSSHVYG